jgi:hypothetical protein
MVERKSRRQNPESRIQKKGTVPVKAVKVNLAQRT